MKELIYRNFLLFLVLFSLLIITYPTSFWWFSLLPIGFYIWNFFNEKKYLTACIVLLIIDVSLNALSFSVRPWAEKVQAEWNKTGYDEHYLANAQESINIIARSVEEYKFNYGYYPSNLNEIQNIYIFNCDLSYRVKQPDGQTNGVPFYYEKIDSGKFLLTGVGKDGHINTKDDLLPQISAEQEKTTGLMKYVIKSFSSEELKREKGVIEMFKKAKKVEK